MTRRNLLLYVLLPALNLAVLTALIRYFDLDLRINRLFFDENAGRFLEVDADRWKVLYHFGPIPGLVLGIGAIVMYVASFLFARCRPYREQCALLGLLLALGPGLIVNGLLKPGLDRPRPCDLTEFGGRNSFVPVLAVGTPLEEGHKSFPSGHASIGFYLLAPIFVLSHHCRRWSITFLVLGLALGLAMGIGRVAQGRHFPSDVLWAGAIVYFTGITLAYVLRVVNDMIPALAWQGQLLSERLIFRLDDYRHARDDKAPAPQVSHRDDSKRRAA